jgi:Lrp/AsnC family transcriptional regulator for asnA, asnC and gidA
MKLSDKESTILAATELRAQTPIEVLKKETGYREHIIRHALRRLKEREVIRPIPVINLHQIGYSVYNVFFSSAALSKAARQALVKSLVTAPEVMWVGEFGGEYHYGVAFCAKRPAHVIEFLHGISRKHKDVFLEKAVSLTISSTLYPRRYLSSRKMNLEPINLKFTADPVEVDELDMRILSALSTHGELSHRQLAAKIPTPLSTLELRIKKLREKKVIVGDIYVVSPSKFDRQSYKLLIYTKGIEPELSKKMHTFCSQHPDIVYLFECFGVWGFEIGVEVHAQEEVSVVMQELYEVFGAAITNIKMLTKFRYPKVRWFPEA